MNKGTDEVTKKIISEIKKIKPEKDYSSLKLKFNPFPSAAIPKFLLPPLDEDIQTKIIHFIRSTYFAFEEEEYAGLTIVGGYGMGKTHLMKYIKSLIDALTQHSEKAQKEIEFSASTCYIDRPEDTPQMVVHRIIEQIGLDNIRKYVWRILIETFEQGKDSFYSKYQPKQKQLYVTKDDWLKLFEEPARSNCKEFVKRFRDLGGDLKLLQESARDIIRGKGIVEDAALADRYLDLIFEEKKADTSWDILAGYVTTRNIQRKEVIFLNSIVQILRNEGFKQLYVFVDEFEDVSKLRGVKLTNYLLTLNTLINREKRWALVVSLTEDALEKIREEATPLYDRLTSYMIQLQPLNEAKSKKLLINYLNVVRVKEENSYSPFSTKSVKKMLEIAKGNYRSFIWIAHKCLEVALAEGKTLIDEEVIDKAKGLRHDEIYNKDI